MNFFAPVLYKLRVRECNSVESLEILWNDLFKYQKDEKTPEGKVFIRITNNRKQQLLELQHNE